MKAVILAGGFGTRLRPITLKTPKPMIRIRGKPFLEYLLNYLRSQGIREYILCLHYMYEKIMEYFGDGSQFGVNISYVVEDRPMGTGGALKKAEEFIQGTFLALNGDTFLEFDLDEMVSFHRKHRGLGTIAITFMRSPKRYGVVKVNPDWRILQFSEKSEAEAGYINAGVYIFEDRLFKFIPRGKEISLEREVIPSLLKNEEFYGFPVEGYFIDIGLLEDLYKFERDLTRRVVNVSEDY